MRRPFLKHKWHFDCTCKRCSDPAELGTNMNALLCVECGTGAVLPRNPLNDGNSFAWKCFRCGREHSLEYVNDTLKELKTFLDAKEAANPIERYEYCLASFAGKVHPNHQFLLEVQTQLALLYGHCPPYAPVVALTRPQLERKIQTAGHVLNVMAKVDPGYSNWRGKLLIELTAAKVLAAKMDFAKGFISVGSLQKTLKEEQFLSLYLAYYQSVLFSENKRLQ